MLRNLIAPRERLLISLQHDSQLQLMRLRDCSGSRAARSYRMAAINPNYPLVHYHLAQAFEKKCHADRARSEYEAFLQIWKDADADISEIAQAKKVLGIVTDP